MFHILSDFIPEVLAVARRLFPGEKESLLAAMDTAFLLGLAAGSVLAFFLAILLGWRREVVYTNDFDINKK